MLMFGVSEFPLLTHQLPDAELSRRAFLSVCVGAAGAAAVANWQPITEAVAAGYDRLATPENIIPGPIVALEPREHDTPMVAKRACVPAAHIWTAHDRSSGGSGLRLAPDTTLWAEHSNTPLMDRTFTAAGTAIITTAEGPTYGEQAYCRLFESAEAVVAVGYEGGMYTYERRLGQSGNTNGEWVRLLTASDDRTLPAHAHSGQRWANQAVAERRGMLIEEVVAGTQTLQRLGYRPWAAVLPSTKMPEMTRIALGPSSCVQTAEELLNRDHTKRYLITERGDIVDIDHLEAKAGETLSLFSHLYHQHLAGQPRPTARVKYTAGSKADFAFAVDTASLRPEHLPDTTFSIMNDVSVQMEGITQRYLVENFPSLKDWWPSGMNSEDLFTNTLGIVGMLALIRQHNLLGRLAGPLQALHSHNPQASPQETRQNIEKIISDIKPLFVKQVLARVAQNLGVREQTQSVTLELPKGMYSLLPTKVSNQDSTTPTRIDLGTVGLRPNNPNVRYQPTHVPIMVATLEYALSRL
jgi:hypothetical protein